MVQHYGIFAAGMGKRTDFPVALLADAITPISENVRTVDGEVHRARGRVEIFPDPVAWDNKTTYDAADAVIHGGVIYVSNVGANVGNEPPHAKWDIATVPDSTAPILHYHRLVTRAGVAYLYAFTKNAIYLWNETQSYWENVVGATDDAAAIDIVATTTEWSTCTYHDKVFATNNKQPVLYGGSGDTFIYLDDNRSAAVNEHGLFLDGGVNSTVVVAKFILTYEDYLFIGNLDLGGAAAHNQMMHCGIGDFSDWDQTGAAAGAIDIPNQTGLNGAAVSGDRMMIFGNDSYGQMWLTADEYLRFEYAEINPHYGCKAPGSIVTKADGTMLFLASDMRMREARTGQDISTGLDDVFARIPVGSVELIRSHRVAEYDEIWWSIPYGLATANNRVITLTADGVWNELSWDIACFGVHSTQAAWTLATLRDAYATLAEWRIYWETIGDMFGDAGFLYDIGADATGATYRLHAATTDKGEDFLGRFSLGTTLTEKFSLNMHKRLLRVRLYLMRDANTTIEVLVKCGPTLYPRVAGSQTIPRPSTLDDADMVILDYPCNFRGRHFEVQVRSRNGDFRFVGMECEFIMDGMR